jgi:hypothetical protein
MNQRTSRDRFRYYLCNECSLRFIEKIPEDLRGFYLNEQYDIPPPDRNGFQPRVESQRWKVDILKTLVPHGSLFEVGPATGEFAFAARQAGFKPKLAEMNERCCRFLRGVLDLDVVHTSDPAGCLASEIHYDAICIWQTLEHIPEFWKLMDRTVDRLASDGVLVVSTPNPMSVQARILGRFWPHVDTPRHLYLIPQKWFRAFAEGRGLSVVLDTTRDVGSLGLNYYGWYLAVRNVIRGKLADHRIHSMARWITNAFRRLEETEGAGCSYTIALRKTKEGAR